jgi:hypothetical protein
VLWGRKNRGTWCSVGWVVDKSCDRHSPCGGVRSEGLAFHVLAWLFRPPKAESAVTIWTDDTVTESWQPMSTAPRDGTPVIVKTEFSYDG